MPNNEGTVPVPAAKLRAGITRSARVNREVKAFFGECILFFYRKNLNSVSYCRLKPLFFEGAKVDKNSNIIAQL
jgi:hypothetical protein